jgi:Lysozyme like domain
MTYQEIEQEWINNGGNPLMAPIMAAIAMAESSGNPSNTTGDNGTSYGLYQIHWTVHPQFLPSLLTNAGYNTNAAIQLSGNGKDLTPWTTYNTGAYTSYLSKAMAAMHLVGPAGTPVSTSDTGGDNTQATGFHLAPSNEWCMNPFDLKCYRGAVGGALDPFSGNAPEWFKQISGTVFLTLGALTFILIGGLWIIFGNNNTKKVFVAAAKDALV